MQDNKCKVCGQSFKSPSELSEHQDMTHAQHGKLGFAGVLGDESGSDSGSGRREVRLDGGRDRWQPPRVGKLLDHRARAFEVAGGGRQT